MSQQAEAARAQMSGRLWVPPEPDLNLHALGGVRAFSCRNLETGDEGIIFVPPKVERPRRRRSTRVRGVTLVDPHDGPISVQESPHRVESER